MCAATHCKRQQKIILPPKWLLLAIYSSIKISMVYPWRHRSPRCNAELFHVFSFNHFFKRLEISQHLHLFLYICLPDTWFSLLSFNYDYFMTFHSVRNTARATLLTSVFDSLLILSSTYSFFTSSIDYQQTLKSQYFLHILFFSQYWCWVPYIIC